MSNIPILGRTSTIDAAQNVELYDEDIKRIIDGPMEWFNARSGTRRNIDDTHRALVEQFERIGLLVDVEIWTLGECRCSISSHHAEQCPNLQPLPETYQFGVVIKGKVHQESGFDYDRQVHQVQNNLLNLPGEHDNVIKFDEKEFLRQQREHKHGH